MMAASVPGHVSSNGILDKRKTFFTAKKQFRGG